MYTLAELFDDLVLFSAILGMACIVQTAENKSITKTACVCLVIGPLANIFLHQWMWQNNCNLVHANYDFMDKPVVCSNHNKLS